MEYERSNLLAIQSEQQIPQSKGDLYQPGRINQLGVILFRMGNVGGEMHEFLGGYRQGRAAFHQE